MDELKSFLEFLRYEKNTSSCTVESYRNDLVQFMEHLSSNDGPATELSRATSDEVRYWIMEMMDKGLEPSSIKRKLSALRSFYRFLLRRGKIKKSPVTLITPPKTKKRLPVFLRETEMNRLLDQTAHNTEEFETLRDLTIIEVFYHTGIRRAELQALTLAQVDYDEMTIKVTGKGNKERIIPFGCELKEALRRYQDRRAEMNPTCNNLFIRKDGTPLTAADIYTHVKKLISEVTSVEKRSPHVLRHTFATAMLNNKAKLTAIKELLGHSSLSATEVYTHVTFEELKKVYNQAHPRA